MLARGFVLGLASGTACLAACAPALVIGLLGRGRSVVQVARFVVLVLVGRLAGYLGFAVVAWAMGRSMAAPLGREAVAGALFVLVALVMAAQGVELLPERELCAAGFVLARLPRQELVAIGGGSPSQRPRDQLRAWARGDVGLPLLIGLTTGISLCPPFVLALTEGAAASSLAGSLTFFGAFFVATSLYFVPALILGPVARREVVARVARLAALVVAAYYLYRGGLLLVSAVAMEWS